MTESPTREIALTWAALGISFSAFLVLGALLAWLAGRPRLVLSLATGLLVLLVAAMLLPPVAAILAKVLRWDLYRGTAGFIALNLIASGSMTVTWLVYAVRRIEGATLETSWWQGGLLYVVGLLATVVALHMIQESFTGDLYRMANTAVGLVGYLVWGAWAAFF